MSTSEHFLKKNIGVQRARTSNLLISGPTLYPHVSDLEKKPNVLRENWLPWICNGYHGLGLIYCLTNSWSLIKSAIHLYSTLCQEWVMTVHFTSKFPGEKVNCSICQIPGDTELKLRNIDIINATRLSIERSLLDACSIETLWQTWYMIQSIIFRIEDGCHCVWQFRW